MSFPASPISTNLPNNTGVFDDPVMASIREKLSSRLKVGFIELIPEEIFTKMTDLAIDDFVNGPRNKRFKIESIWMGSDNPLNTTGKANYVKVETPTNDYNPVSDPTTLPGMIYLELVALAKVSISKTIKEDPRFKETYDQNISSTIIPILDEIVSNNTEAFVRSLMSNIVNFTMSSAINNLRNTQGMGNYIPPVSGVRF